MADDDTPQGAAVDPTGSTAIEVRRHTDLAALTDLGRILVTGELDTEVVDDPEEISREIIEQLLAAESDDELEQVGSAQGWAEFEGVPIEVHGFRWRPSDYKEGSRIYFIVAGVDMRDGERVMLTTGSKNVIAQLINLTRRDRLPAVRMLARADKPTKGGFYPQFLVSTPEELETRRAGRIAARADGGDEG